MVNFMATDGLINVIPVDSTIDPSKKPSRGG